MPADCLFCKIFAKEVPSKEVIREDDVLAFDDIRPVAPTHVIVIPKEHIPSVRELSAKHAPLLARMMEIANRVAADRSIARQGYRITFNTGPNAGQSVYHLHMHVLGGRAMGWPPG